MKIKFAILFIAAIFFVSCEEDEAHIQLVNKVHNVRLDKVSYGNFPLGTYLLPGQSTANILLSERYDNVSFPENRQIEFYMVNGDSKVFLKTKEYFQLKAGQNLVIEITDSTEVVNPMTEE